MGDTVARIRAAIADHHVRTGYQPRYVVVSAEEDLPAIISGATTVPSKDLNPGHPSIKSGFGMALQTPSIVIMDKEASQHLNTPHHA